MKHRLFSAALIGTVLTAGPLSPAACQPVDPPPPPTAPPAPTPNPTPTATPSPIGTVPTGPCAAAFVCEDFIWSGDHAATTANGTGRTVWWNSDRWDTRHDFAYDSQDSHAHIDIHKAASASHHHGGEDNSDPTVNGAPGVPGVGIMRIHETAIASARLRSPVVLDRSRPAIVRFEASRQVTGGHWWEVALTPDITAAEHTAIPGSGIEMEGPLFSSGKSRGGPGHINPADSINVVASGWPDDCSNATFLAVRQTLGGATTDFVNKRNDMAELTKIPQSERDELYPWEMRFWPDHAEVALDADRDGSYETVESFPVTIPWGTAYVHLVSVAYHAQVHPPAPCNQGQSREMAWRNVQVGPVVTPRTAVFPRENGTDNVPRRTGWMLTDGRDVNRFGDLGGLAQPNPAKYDNYGPVLLCSADTQLSGFYCPNRTPRATLPVDLPDLSTATGAKFVYDIIRSPSEGQAQLIVNGFPIGALPVASTVRPTLTDHWARRSIDIPLSVLHPGANTVEIAFAGDVRIDRLQIEMSFSS